MTTPISGTPSLHSSEPMDISRYSQSAGSYRSSASFLPRSSSLDAVGFSRESHASRSVEKDDGFSFDDIPIVGEFLALVTSLFTSHSGGTRSALAQNSETLPPPQLMASSGPSNVKPDGPVERDSALDLSRLLDLPSPAIRPDAEAASVASALGRSNAKEAESEAASPTLPNVSELVTHPSNRLSAETLQLLQARYLNQISEKG